VNGTLSKLAGSFKIDHPLDPENKWLSHSFVESPDMMNVYNGNIVLDGRAEATVKLPAYFTALNKDYRYQLTPIGGYPPVYVASKIDRGSFKIAGGHPGLEVSWQVTGIRQDAYAREHPIVAETRSPRPSPAPGFSCRWARTRESGRSGPSRPQPRLRAPKARTAAQPRALAVPARGSHAAAQGRCVPLRPGSWPSGSRTPGA
jgi:hypothetical protein